MFSTKTLVGLVLACTTFFCVIFWLVLEANFFGKMKSHGWKNATSSTFTHALCHLKIARREGLAMFKKLIDWSWIIIKRLFWLTTHLFSFMWKHKKVTLVMATVIGLTAITYRFWPMVSWSNQEIENKTIVTVAESTDNLMPTWLIYLIGVSTIIIGGPIAILSIIGIWKIRSNLSFKGMMPGSIPLPGSTFWKFIGRFLLRSAVVFMILFAGYMLITTVFPDAWHNHVIPQVMQFQSARPTEFWISLSVVSFLFLVIIWPKKQVELDKDQKKKRDELRDNIIYWPFEMVKYVVIIGLLVGIPTLFIADAVRGNKSIGERQRELAATNTPRVGTQQASGKQVIQRIEGEAVKGRWTTVYDLGRRSMTWQDAPILVLPNGELSQVFLATPGTPAGPGVGKLLSAAFMVPQDSPHEKVKFVIEYYE